jgi:hypothetical protein
MILSQMAGTGKVPAWGKRSRTLFLPEMRALDQKTKMDDNMSKIVATFIFHLIRHRDWGYLAAAYGLSFEDREELRRQVVAQYGEGLELIASFDKVQKDRSPQKRGERGHYCCICKRHCPNWGTYGFAL